jgi:hypothetical protein
MEGSAVAANAGRANKVEIFEAALTGSCLDVIGQAVRANCCANSSISRQVISLGAAYAF